MIYEIFNCMTGKTEGHRCGEKRRDETLARLDRAGFVYDWLPAREGFYLIDMRESVKAGPFADRMDAIRQRDFENLASDTNSFSIVEQRL